MFKKRKILNRKRTFSSKKYYNKRSKKQFRIFKWLLFLFVSFVLFSFVLSAVLYKKYIETLPPVEEIKNMDIAQTSIIYDKYWDELYKIFKENRTYIDYKDINKNIINALVAWEDQRFWTTPWFDLIWIIRATLNWVISWDFRWTSWLSQQLMKVTYLTNERTLERKIKEFYLSWKLNKVFDKQKIIELYLNKIFFWSNAYWIEQAAKTFFWVSASDLWILQSSVLASLPKAPSWLSPYMHKDRLMGYPFIFNINQQEDKTKILNQKDIEENKIFLYKLIKFIENLELKKVNNLALICNIDKNQLKPWSFRVDSDSCSSMWFEDLLGFLNSIRIKDWDYFMEYQTWRKDYILGRMLEDEYINFDDYKKAIIDSFGFEFQKYRTNIKNPHFVMYIKEYLEKKYGKEIIEQWGFRIYTTLDPDLQEKAEEIVEKYWEINETKFWARNASLISLDNETWWVLAMVWWRDYFDEENDWNNNMTTSRLQPWSTFKPFVYWLAIENNNIWSATPIYDLQTEFPWDYIPNNFDGEFQWKMTVSSALNNSRNIPAIKMFYLAWWEEKIISFMEKLGVKTLREFKEEYKEKYPWRIYVYAAPMALWTGLMTPLELASAYSTFANMWIRKEVNPIIRIVDRKWNVIEDIEREKDTISEDTVIEPSLAYIINSILSDEKSRPEFWNNYLSIPWRKLASKTWTSTKQYTEGTEKIIAPRNLWTAWYTPQITTVSWVWNTNWEELFLNWNWLEAAWPIMKDFMAYAHEWKKVSSWSRPLWVENLKISSISWLLPWEWFPSNFLTSSNFINPPTSFDDSLKFVEVDRLCFWKVTKNTPVEAIRRWYLVNFRSINPDNSKWEEPVLKWVNDWGYKEKYSRFWNVITYYSWNVCSRNWKVNVVTKTSIEDSKLTIGRNDIKIWYVAGRNIRKMDIYLWNKLLKSIDNINISQKWFDVALFVPFNLLWTKANLKIRLVDSQYYHYDEDISVDIVGR